MTGGEAAQAGGGEATQASGGEVTDGIWRFESRHPDWEPGEDWEPDVGWWVVRGPGGLLLIDPLVTDWQQLDELAESHGGVAGVARTVFWHERSCTEAARRYGVQLWAAPAPVDAPLRPYDAAALHGLRLPGGAIALEVKRKTELSLWLPEQRALVFGDAMLRDADGRLRLCPASWVGGERGLHELCEGIRTLAELGPRHVLVSHGPLVLGDAEHALAAALA